MHPPVEHFVPLFKYDHLPPKLQDVSKRFHDLALWMMTECSGPECSAGLRKLLEAKDCAVRASLNGGFAHPPKD